jgi:cobalt-precorrin 5A hydrolase
MDLDQAMIVAGIGCRMHARAEDIEAAIAEALRLAGCSRDELNAIATAAKKGEETGIPAVALMFGLPLIYVSQADLEAAAPRCETRSWPALQHTGLPSVSEAAALAAAGPKARLLLPRVAAKTATCALAITDDAP